MSITDEFLETPENSEEEIQQEEVKTDNLDEISKEDLAEALLKTNKTKEQLSARLAKAEAKLKEQKITLVTNTEPTNIDEQIDIRFLKRDGLSDEDISALKLIQAGYKSQGKNITLMEAQNDELYIARQTAIQAKERSAKAQIIGGSGTYSEESLKISKMSNEEHAAYAKQEAEKILSQM